MKGTGEMTRQMGEASWFMLMGTFTKESGRMTRRTGVECTSTKMEPSMKDNGWRTNSTAKVDYQ